MLMDAYWQHGEMVPSTADPQELFQFSKHRRGWVYVAQPSLGNALKIGRTSKTPQQRMQSLETSGVEGTFTLLHAVSFVNSHWAEGVAHDHWRDHNTRKEFFNVNAHDVYAHLLATQRQETVLLNNWSRSHLLHAPTFDQFKIHTSMASA